MALNIRKVVAQRTKYNQNNNKKGNFYIISIEIAFLLVQELYVPDSFYFGLIYLYRRCLFSSPMLS